MEPVDWLIAHPALVARLGAWSGTEALVATVVGLGAGWILSTVLKPRHPEDVVAGSESTAAGQGGSDDVDDTADDGATESILRRFHLATRDAEIGVWELTLATGQVYWNEAMFELYGVDPSVEPSYDVWKSCLLGADVERAETELAAAIEGTTARFVTEFRIKRDGQVRHIVANATVERSEDGSPIRVTGVNSDVTHLRVAEERLRRNEERLEEAGRLAAVGGWEVDMVSMAVTWSRQVRRIHEVDDDYEPTLDSAIEFYAPEARPVIRNLVDHAIKTGVPWDVELPFITGKNRRVWVRAIGKAEFREGVCVRLAGTFQEITAQRAAAEALRLSQERLNVAIEGTQDGFWDIDLVDEENAWFTPRFLELAGLSRGARLGDVLDRIHRRDLKRVLGAAQRHLNGRRPFEAEFRFVERGGPTRWFRARGQARFDGAGRALRLAGSITDVQAHRDAAAEIRRERDRAAHASVAKSEFLANMSHEIRTPMTAILGYAELLDDDSTDLVTRRGYVGTILRNGNHLLSLINDILDLSKIESGKFELDKRRVSIGEVVDEVVGLLSIRAVDRGIDLQVRSGERLPRQMLTDPVRLRQVLVNLVGNAIKFTEKGHVRLELRADSDRRIRFDVIDTGIGIPADRLQVVFQAFHQADSSITRRFGGTGLGLRISKSLVGMMGGVIEVQSEPGVGSRFTVRVPIGIPPAQIFWTDGESIIEGRNATGVPQESVPERPLSERRVLVAEDGPDNQLLIRHILSKAGAEVEVAENGRVALERWSSAVDRGEAYDLIVMDVQMPELDGLSATRQLRRLGVEVPIIALTANTMAGDRERCLEAGCNSFQSKPIDRHDLVEQCRRSLRERAAEGGL